MGAPVTSLFDAVGQIVAMLNPLELHNTLGFDAAGRQVVSTDANGHSSTTMYDAATRGIASANALAHRTTNIRDAAGQPQALPDARGSLCHITLARAMVSALNVVLFACAFTCQAEDSLQSVEFQNASKWFDRLAIASVADKPFVHITVRNAAGAEVFKVHGFVLSRYQYTYIRVATIGELAILILEEIAGEAMPVSRGPHSGDLEELARKKDALRRFWKMRAVPIPSEPGVP